MRVGEVVGVFLDGSVPRAIGLEVLGAGGARRFLPWVAARFEPGLTRIESALLLVDGVDSYERLGAVPLRDRAALARLVAAPDGLIERIRDAVIPDVAIPDRAV